MKALPNILTSLRLVLTLFVFLALATAAGAVPYVSEHLTPEAQFSLQRWAFWSFVIAAVTDWFDGWLARKLDAVSVWGAILDPIGDKVLVCGAILGLLALGGQPAVVLPAGLMLFREFTVSALREVGAGKGIKLPVTRLAKWKTTLQLIAIGILLLGPTGDKLVDGITELGIVLLWTAAIVTLYTGYDYFRSGVVYLMEERREP